LSRFCNPSGDSLLKGRLGNLVFPGMTGGKGKLLQSSYSIPEHLAWHLFGKTVGASDPRTVEQVGIKILLHFSSHLSHDPFNGFSISRLGSTFDWEHKASHKLLYVFSLRQNGRYNGWFWNWGRMHSEQDKPWTELS